LEGEDPVAQGARSAMVFGRVQMSPCPGNQFTEKQSKFPILKVYYNQVCWLLNGRTGNVIESLRKDKKKKYCFLKMVSLP
jgi:hypothetical protein